MSENVKEQSAEKPKHDEREEEVADENEEGTISIPFWLVIITILHVFFLSVDEEASSESASDVEWPDDDAEEVPLAVDDREIVRVRIDDPEEWAACMASRYVQHEGTLHFNMSRMQQELFALIGWSGTCLLFGHKER